MCRALPLGLSYAVDRMKDCHTYKERMSHRRPVTVEVIPGWIDDQLQVSRQCVHNVSPDSFYGTLCLYQLARSSVRLLLASEGRLIALSQVYLDVVSCPDLAA